jgi:hypothetical protein
MQHKLGPCPVLETSIIIVISSPHRKDSLAAVHFAIDELKRVVPIWKKVSVLYNSVYPYPLMTLYFLQRNTIHLEMEHGNQIKILKFRP